MTPIPFKLIIKDFNHETYYILFSSTSGVPKTSLLHYAIFLLLIYAEDILEKIPTLKENDTIWNPCHIAGVRWEALEHYTIRNLIVFSTYDTAHKSPAIIHLFYWMYKSFTCYCILIDCRSYITHWMNNIKEY